MLGQKMMTIENTIYKQFKPYNSYKYNYKGNNQDKTNQKPKREFNTKAFIGSVAGVGGALLINSKIYKKPIFGWGENKNPGVLKEVAEILLTAGMANLGGVIGGSIGKDKEKIKAKLKEAGFQIMNTTIPMLGVTGATVLCNSVKALNNVPTKIIASFSGMTLGAAIATKITNLGKSEGEKRKYMPTDVLADFDDIVATIKIGFKELAEKIPVDHILPCIYAYNGYRSGNKE